MLDFPVTSPLFCWFPRPHLLPHLPSLLRLQDGLYSIHPRPPPAALEEGADWSREGVRLAPWAEQVELICTQGCSGRVAEAPALPGGARDPGVSTRVRWWVSSGVPMDLPCDLRQVTPLGPLFSQLQSKRLG